MPGKTHVQSWDAAPGRWTFASASPDADLGDSVAEFWEVEGRLAPFRERVLPNGCLELMVNLGPMHETVSGTQRTRWDHSWFSGLHEESIEIESKVGTHLVSARLRPLGAWMFFGESAANAANAVVDLDVFLHGGAAALRAELLSVSTPAERFEVLEGFLRRRLPDAATPSAFVSAAVEQIENAHGNLRVSSLHEDLGVSRKHLTVRFAREIGIPPKSYAQLRRFVWTLARLRQSESVDWAQLAAVAGYSDQSHLVRDFQRVAAASPTEFLRTRSPDNTALLEDMR